MNNNSIAKLSNKSVEFLQNVPGFVNGKQEMLIMALARAISTKLPLPSGEVINPGESYLDIAFNSARSYVSQLSDLTVFDASRVLDLTKTFWLVRYKVAFHSGAIYSQISAVSESSFLGYGLLLSNEQLTFIQCNSTNLVILYNGITSILEQLAGIPDKESTGPETVAG